MISAVVMSGGDGVMVVFHHCSHQINILVNCSTDSISRPEAYEISSAFRFGKFSKINSINLGDSDGDNV